MKVTSIEISNYSKPEGRIRIHGDDETAITFKLTEQEAHYLMATALQCFEQRQAEIANSIRDMKPTLLIAPEVPDAEIADDILTEEDVRRDFF